MLCWGNASFGQLGLGGIDEEIVLEPRKSDFFLNKRVRDVGCGLRHTVFVLDDGTVYTCGCNDLGQLGHDKARKRPGKFRSDDLRGFCGVVGVAVVLLCFIKAKIASVCMGQTHAQQFSQEWTSFYLEKHCFAGMGSCEVETNSCETWQSPHIFACCAGGHCHCFFY